MNLNYLKRVSFCLMVFLFSQGSAQASELVNGEMIKNQAQSFFENNNLGLRLVISDKRTFFPCSSLLEFKQRTKNNWTTVLVTCPNENWSTLVRSKQSTVKIFDDNQNLIFEPLRVVALAKNISKGQVLSQDDFVLIDRAETKFHGAFKEIKDVVGRKAKVSLASGTVVKARHLETVYLINKEDTVLVIAQNSKLMITTSAIALEEGQLGDMIAIENIKSKKILKAIITGRKKVSPITNM